jgi:hypothetical protein
MNAVMLNTDGKQGSIAVVERFIKTLKREGLRMLAVVPLLRRALQRELSLYGQWCNESRPHTTLAGATPRGSLLCAATGLPSPSLRAAPRLAESIAVRTTAGPRQGPAGRPTQHARRVRRQASSPAARKRHSRGLTSRSDARSWRSPSALASLHAWKNRALPHRKPLYERASKSRWSSTPTRCPEASRLAGMAGVEAAL